MACSRIVEFGPGVVWMSLVFDPRSAFLQTEDKLTIFIDDVPVQV